MSTAAGPGPPAAPGRPPAISACSRNSSIAAQIGLNFRQMKTSGFGAMLLFPAARAYCTLDPLGSISRGDQGLSMTRTDDEWLVPAAAARALGVNVRPLPTVALCNSVKVR